jgi:hypothetical protein
VYVAAPVLIAFCIMIILYFELESHDASGSTRLTLQFGDRGLVLASPFMVALSDVDCTRAFMNWACAQEQWDDNAMVPVAQVIRFCLHADEHIPPTSRFIPAMRAVGNALDCIRCRDVLPASNTSIKVCVPRDDVHVAVSTELETDDGAVAGSSELQTADDAWCSNEEMARWETMFDSATTHEFVNSFASFP